MATADTAKLIASLSLKDGFTGPLKTMDKQLSKFDAHLKSTDSRGLKAGKQIGTGIKAGAAIAAAGIGFLASQVLFGLDSLSKLEDADTQTNAVLKSTKGIAGVTGAEVRSLAEDFENLNATMDDKVIQSGENLLLTFTNIRKEAFEPTLQAALDLNQALGKGEEGLQGTITQVGKALNDPTKGLTALRRVGVAFTADQEKQIKALQKSGDLLGAQRIILRELGTEFGGSFAAKGKTATGTIAGIGDAAEDLQKTVATGLFPTIQKFLPRIREALSSPALLHGVEQLGDAIGDLFSDDNINEGAKVLGGLFETAKDVAPILQNAAGKVGALIKTAVDLFKSLPPEIQALAVAGAITNKLTGGLVTNIAGGLISAVISSFKGLMNVNAAVVNVNGAVGGPGAIPDVVKAGGAGLLATTSVVIAAAVASTFAFLQTHNGPGSSGSFTPTIGAAFDNKPVDASSLFKGVDWEKVSRQMKEGGDHTTDAIENARRDAGKAADRSYDAVEKLRAGTLSVDVANASAIAAAVRADRKADVAADRTARGLTGKHGPSTSILPRLDFLAGDHSGKKDADVIRALASGFESGTGKAFKSTAALKDAIKAVSKDVKTLPPKFAGPIGQDLARLKSELARRTEKATRDGAEKTARASRLAGQRTTQAIKDLDLSVTVPVSVKQYVSGRLLEAATGRFTSTIVGSKGAVAEFG